MPNPRCRCVLYAEQAAHESGHYRGLNYLVLVLANEQERGKLHVVAARKQR